MLINPDGITYLFTIFHTFQEIAKYSDITLIRPFHHEHEENVIKDQLITNLSSQHAIGLIYYNLTNLQDKQRTKISKILSSLSSSSNIIIIEIDLSLMNTLIFSALAQTNFKDQTQQQQHDSLWIYLIYCPNSTSTTSPDEKMILSFMIRNIPKTYQINSHLYFMTCTEVYEIYYLRNKLIVRPILSNIQPSSEKLASTTVRRRDFMKETIILGLAKTFFSINDGRSLTMDNLKYMTDFLNFSASFQGNHGWHDMTHQLNQSTNDLGGSATAMMPIVAASYRFLNVPTYTDPTKAYFIRPRQRHINGAIFLHAKPFSPEAWVGLATFLAFMILCHYIMSRKIANALLWILSCLTLQGYPLVRRNSLRTVTFFGSFLGVVLYALYSGQLISSLSTRTEHLYTLNELIDEGYTFGISNDSYLRGAKESNEYTTNKDSIATKIFSNLHRAMGETDIYSGILYIFHHSYGFITEESIYEKFHEARRHNDSRFTINEEIVEIYCTRWREVTIPEYTVQQSPITRRDSPFVNHFNYARVRSLETGIWHFFQNRRQTFISHLKPQCASSPSHSFGLRDVLLPLCIIMSGFALAWICFLLEFINAQLSKIFDPK